jgi:plasmid stability protein
MARCSAQTIFVAHSIAYHPTNHRAADQLRHSRRDDIIGIIYRPEGALMPDIILRNLDEELKERLRRRAARNRRSMNAELREIVRAALSRPQRVNAAELKKLAADIRALSAGRKQTPAERLLRESRDER